MAVEKTRLDCARAEQTLHAAEQALAVRDVTAALRLFTAAELAGADADACAGGRWFSHMLLGNMELAWAESDAIEQRGRPDPLRYWNGNDWRGEHVLVRCLHGLGDTLHFVRYLHLLRQDAASVTLEAQPALKELLLAASIADHVMTWGEKEPRSTLQVEINELPRLFRVGLDALVVKHPYLCLPNSDLPDYGARGEHRDFNVGLVWAAGDYNPARSVPAHLLDALVAIKGVAWHGLQAGTQHADALRWRQFHFVQHCNAEPNVLELAQRTAALDLLITVDTMNAHLGGALGVPTWAMLPYASDWRWMLKRNDSPWYPGMRLFRQPSPGNWQSVLHEVAVELRRLLR